MSYPLESDAETLTSLSAKKAEEEAEEQDLDKSGRPPFSASPPPSLSSLHSTVTVCKDESLSHSDESVDQGEEGLSSASPSPSPSPPSPSPFSLGRPFDCVDDVINVTQTDSEEERELEEVEEDDDSQSVSETDGENSNDEPREVRSALLASVPIPPNLFFKHPNVTNALDEVESIAFDEVERDALSLTRLDEMKWDISHVIDVFLDLVCERERDLRGPIDRADVMRVFWLNMENEYIPFLGLMGISVTLDAEGSVTFAWSKEMNRAFVDQVYVTMFRQLCGDGKVRQI